MATATDAARKIHELGKGAASSIASTPTGIEPGYDPNTGITWKEDGRARHRSSSGVGVMARVESFTVAHNSPDTVDFTVSGGSDLYDSSAFWDAGTPDEFTFPSDGAYVVTYNVVWDIGTTGYRETYILFSTDPGAGSGSIFPQYAQLKLPVISGQEMPMGRTTIVQAFAGDHIIFKGRQTNGGDLDIIEGTLTIHRIGPKIAALA